MLVQRKPSRRRIVILSSAFIVMAIVGLIFFGRRYLSRPETEGAGETSAPITNVSLSRIRNVNTSILADPRLLELRAGEEFSVGTQVPARVQDPNTPEPPGSISVTDPGIGRSVSLTWTLPPDARITGVRIYRSELAGQLGVVIADLPAVTAGYQDAGLVDRQTYYYLVRTTMTSGTESANVVQQPGTPTDILPPAPPTGVRTEGMDGGSLIVRWTNPTDSDFSHVKVYRSSILGELGTLLSDTVQTSDYRDDTVQPGTEYYYTIISVDTAGNESGVNLLSTPGKANLFVPTF